MKEKTCIVCGAPLTGKQREYCSSTCYSRNYYRKHRAEKLKSAREYRERNRDKINERKREFRRKQRERWQRKIRNWKEEDLKPTKSKECSDCLYFDTCNGKENCEYKKENL